MGKSDDVRKLRERRAAARERVREGTDPETGEREVWELPGTVVVAELEAGDTVLHSSQEEFDRLRVPAVKKKGRGKEDEFKEERVTAYVSRVELEAMEEAALAEHRTLSSWARMVLNKAVGR